MPVVGSSPRSRGTLRPDRVPLLRRRFIPALAGNTQRRSGWCVSRSVHPRARGEHMILAIGAQESGGSSPRSRGTHGRIDQRVIFCRFIPALAGNTPAGSTYHGARPVHPRARGEHATSSSKPATSPGSSPRSRGTPLSTSGNMSHTRFIPALAGNTRARRQAARNQPVHPRARGEHIASMQSETVRIGSSPRSRGTHLGEVNR